MFVFSLVFHVIAATIWTGGHLLLVFTVLIPALKTKDLQSILAFEARYEKIGMPSLIILIITGLYQACYYLPDLTLWFNPGHHFSQHILLKLVLLLITLTMAINVKFNILKKPVIPLYLLAGHIITVTLVSVLFLIVGLSFRHNIF